MTTFSPESKPGVAVSSATGLSILLLSGEQTERLWINDLLAHAGPESPFNLSWCSDPAQCEDFFAEERFDTVIWDCGFYLEDPATFLALINDMGGDCPIIAYSAEPDARIARPIMMAGAADYFCKAELDARALWRSINHNLYRLAAQAHQRQVEQQGTAVGILAPPYFYDRLQHSVDRAERNNEHLGVLNLQLDGLNTIREVYGIRIARRLVSLAAGRLRSCLRKCDTLAQLESDEFALILGGLQGADSAMNVARKLLEAFQEPFEIDQNALWLTLSAGIVTFPEGGSDPELLFLQASRAMYEARQETGISLRYYDEALNRSIQDQLALEADLREAIRNDQLELHYQPRVDLGAERIVGVEALVRWRHPGRGLLMPAEFIPAAERSGMIVPLGYAVLEQACRDLYLLQQLGNGDLVMSVNLSFRQFFDRKMAETIFRIVYNAEINTGNLCFELTEAALLHDAAYTDTCLQELAKLGISFALDNFGSGQSSLTLLRKLPISTIKIDRQFVQGVPYDHEDQVIVRSSISLAHNLQMHVVAEGVETPEQLEFLQYAHCDQMQGYHFSAALPMDELLMILDQDYNTAQRSQDKV